MSLNEKYQNWEWWQSKSDGQQRLMLLGVIVAALAIVGIAYVVL